MSQTKWNFHFLCDTAPGC